MNNSTEQPSSWSGLNKDNYNHTEPNDPYFSAEQASKRGPERHYPGYNFLGPGTEFAARMIGSDFYKQMMINAGRQLVGTEPYNVPINKLDRCAFEHDAVYNRNNNTEKNIRESDIKFRECSDKIKDPKLKYYALIQFSKSVIGLKEFGEDMGFIKPELYANINKNITDLNNTLAKNHTIPSTKEEQQKQDRNFYIVNLLLFFKLIGKVATDLIVIPVGTRYTTEKLIKIVNNINIDLITRLPSGLRPIFEFIVNGLIGRQTASQIINKLANLGLPAIQAFIGTLFEYNFFGIGVPGQIAKYGLYKIAQFIIDKFLTRISTQFGSNSWREGNIMTKEEIEQIIKGDDPAIHTAEQQADTQFRDAFGFSVQNTRAREIIELFNNIENLTNRQKIARFGNFNRAIIQIRNIDRPTYRASLFNIIYILLNGTIQSSLVADITVERLRNILNQRISEPDIDTLLSRPRLILKLENTFKFQYDREVFRQYTYMEFIDKFLELFTLNGLEELLS